MPEIIPNQNFKHGTQTYEEGTSYDVSEGEAYYFQMVGWVGPKAVGSDAVTLSVQDGQIGHGAMR